MLVSRQIPQILTFLAVMVTTLGVWQMVSAGQIGARFAATTAAVVWSCADTLAEPHGFSPRLESAMAWYGEWRPSLAGAAPWLSRRVALGFAWTRARDTGAHAIGEMVVQTALSSSRVNFLAGEQVILLTLLSRHMKMWMYDVLDDMFCGCWTALNDPAPSLTASGSGQVVGDAVVGGETGDAEEDVHALDALVSPPSPSTSPSGSGSDCEVEPPVVSLLSD